MVEWKHLRVPLARPNDWQLFLAVYCFQYLIQTVFLYSIRVVCQLILAASINLQEPMILGVNFGIHIKEDEFSHNGIHLHVQVHNLFESLPSALSSRL